MTSFGRSGEKLGFGFSRAVPFWLSHDCASGDLNQTLDLARSQNMNGEPALSVFTG